MTAIAAWLQEIGLGQHAEAFAAQEIDFDILPDLSEADLERLGLALGPRKRLLRAIAALGPRPSAPPAEKPAAERIAEPGPRPEAERRHLTVMFADLVGSTALAAALDSEDMRRVILAFQQAAAAAVTAFGGSVAKFMGDGMLAHFGWPRAHEDEPERAVRAALALRAGIPRPDAPPAPPLALRIGIATGLVVVGDLIGEGGAQEEAVVGETPNLAARLQALAEPGQVVIAAATRRLLGALFEVEGLGAVALKGFARPVEAFRVLRDAAPAARFQALRPGRRGPLVGRDDELALLQGRWRLAAEGEGQAVLLAGEAGIGKSRLLQALAERLAGEAPARMAWQCAPHLASSAFHPIVAELEQAAGFLPEDRPEARLGKLERLLAPAPATVPETTALLAALLSLPAPGPPLPAWTPQKQKERTIAALVERLAGIAAERPLLCLFEDVHWADPSTLELLDRLIERIGGARILLVMTARPDFGPRWSGRPQVTQLSLARLGRRQGAAIVAQIGGDALPAGIAEQIVARTDGVPLFLEELTRAVLEAGPAGERILPTVIPATLHDSLMARLDHLAPVREVAQIGACLGREFRFDLLAAVAARPEPELRLALDRLASAELLFRRGAGAEEVFTFKHALVQDAAYESLLKSRRQALHARIAAAIGERWPELAEAQPELLSHHCERAGQLREAIAHGLRAAHRAMASAAFSEAVTQARRLLGLLAGLPEGRERDERGLELQLLLGRALMIIIGYTRPEVGEAFGRARDLCRSVGTADQLLMVFWGLANVAKLSADYRGLLRIARELIRSGRRRVHPAAHLEGIRHASESYFLLGRPRTSDRLSRNALGKHDPSRLPCLSPTSPVDFYTTLRSIHSQSLVLLGYPGQARLTASRAVQESRRLDHPLSHLTALSYALRTSCLVRDLDGATLLHDEQAALVTEQASINHQSVTAIFRGWLALEQADAMSTALIDAGLTACDAAGTRWYRPQYHAFRAASLLRTGDHDAAMSAIGKALSDMDETGERWAEAEVHRIKGELLAAQGRHAEAEASFRHSLAIARRQGARWWELRTAVSLARLWQRQGRHAEAYDLLAPIHGWFTEGFDLPDLIEAATLLQELRDAAAWSPLPPAHGCPGKLLGGENEVRA